MKVSCLWYILKCIAVVLVNLLGLAGLKYIICLWVNTTDTFWGCAVRFLIFAFMGLLLYFMIAFQKQILLFIKSLSELFPKIFPKYIIERLLMLIVFIYGIVGIVMSGVLALIIYSIKIVRCVKALIDKLFPCKEKTFVLYYFSIASVVIVVISIFLEVIFGVRFAWQAEVNCVFLPLAYLWKLIAGFLHSSEIATTLCLIFLGVLAAIPPVRQFCLVVLLLPFLIVVLVGYIIFFLTLLIEAVLLCPLVLIFMRLYHHLTIGHVMLDGLKKG